MPVTKLPSPQMGMNVEELTNLMFRYYRELQYLLNGNLDENNVVRAQEAIIANLLAGTITADQIDVTQGKILTAQIEDLIVGGNVVMGPDATISWSKVTNQPDIPTTADITQITADYVSTPNLITNIARVNRHLSLGGGYKTSSSLSFDGIGSIDASDDVLYFSAMSGIVFETYTDFDAYVSGLEGSGYATQDWVNDNFVAK